VDGLLDLAARVGVARPAREVDQLLAAAGCASAALLELALSGLGVPAAALSGGQAGLLVTGAHGAGVVAAVRPARVRRLLWRRVVVVVAGAQGLDAGGDIVTLGADGSRTTAAALVAGLAGRGCLIHAGAIHAGAIHPRVIHMGLTEGACHGAQRLIRPPRPAAAPASLSPPPPPRRVGSRRTG
jgi:aspartate kinase